MLVLRRGPIWEARAPAKLNLLLDVIGKRSDGFHELETLMVPISLFDTLLFRPHNEPRLTLSCDAGAACRATSSKQAMLPASPDNLVIRAIELLRERANCTLGATMHLIKRIPTEAGLGGGSSDAAAALLVANRAWNLNLKTGQLAQWAAELGSDVPFFVHNGAAICRGRGEKITRLRTPAGMAFVVVKPPAGLRTAAVFAACCPQSQRYSAEPLATQLAAGNLSGIAARIHNSLQTPAEEICPMVRQIRRHFERLDFVAHQMSGSGTSYFGICRSARQARRYASLLRAQGLGLVAATHCLN